MVEAHIYVRFKAEAQNEANRMAFARRCQSLLSIPEVKGVRTGTPADARSESAWDICLVLEVDTAQSAATLSTHATYKSLLDPHDSPQLAVTKEWNFQMQL